MTVSKDYYIEKEIALNLKGFLPETLLTIILTSFAAVRDVTGKDYNEMINRFKLDHETADATHMAALLIYEETVVINVSRRVIGALFGRKSDHMVRRAQIKNDQLPLFRKKMNAVRDRYKEITMSIYDKEIPF